MLSVFHEVGFPQYLSVLSFQKIRHGDLQAKSTAVVESPEFWHVPLRV